MRKIAFTTLAALGAIALPAAAQAQATQGPDITIGASAGLHDLDVNVDDADFDEFDIDDSGEIIGGFIAADFPLGEALFVGAEGNYHFGTGPIDAEYGVSGRLGLRTQGGAKIYARGGYQWVDLDVSNAFGIDEDAFNDVGIDLDTTEGDYLVGAGVEFPISALVLRANVDTLGFDTLRGTVGVGLRF